MGTGWSKLEVPVVIVASKKTFGCFINQGHFIPFRQVYIQWSWNSTVFTSWNAWLKWTSSQITPRCEALLTPCLRIHTIVLISFRGFDNFQRKQKMKSTVVDESVYTSLPARETIAATFPVERKNMTCLLIDFRCRSKVIGIPLGALEKGSVVQSW